MSPKSGRDEKQEALKKFKNTWSNWKLEDKWHAKCWNMLNLSLSSLSTTHANIAVNILSYLNSIFHGFVTNKASLADYQLNNSNLQMQFLAQAAFIDLVVCVEFHQKMLPMTMKSKDWPKIQKDTVSKIPMMWSGRKDTNKMPKMDNQGGT